MTLIDHRVLISAPPEVVWQLLGDLTALPKWYINCTQTSILTTQQTGPGTRRRNTMKGSPDIVEEFLSWYNNLGYEYHIIDGIPFARNRGRVRLQAIPEGTVVQWTIEYELSGFLSSVRDRLSLQRRLNKEIAGSLKRLKRLVESTGIRMDSETRERVSLRPAPSAKERAAIGETAAKIQKVAAEDNATHQEMDRQPDHTAKTPPSGIKPVPAVVDEGDLPPSPLINEPPINEGDTRPNPALTVQAAPDEQAVPPVYDAPTTPPDFAGQPDHPVSHAQADTADDAFEAPTEPKKPEDLIAALDAKPPITEPEATPEEAQDPTAEALAITEDDTPTEPKAPAELRAALEQDLPVANEVGTGEVLAMETQEPEQQPPASAPPTLDAATPAETKPLFDEVKPVGPSIWDVFGIQAPSAEETGTPEVGTSEPAHELPQPDDALTRTQTGRPGFISARSTLRHQGMRKLKYRNKYTRKRQV